MVAIAFGVFAGISLASLLIGWLLPGTSWWFAPLAGLIWGLTSSTAGLMLIPAEKNFGVKHG